MAGDVHDSKSTRIVMGLQGIQLDPVTVGRPQNGWVISFDSTLRKYKAIPNPASGQPGPQGAPGPAGPPGVGVPAGGTTGQVLTKNSNVNYDDSWQTPSSAGIVVATTPFTTPNAGAFTQVHGLGYNPSFAAIAVGSDGTSLIGIVGWQLAPLSAVAWDGTNFYLYASDSGIEGFVLSIK